LTDFLVNSTFLLIYCLFGSDLLFNSIRHLDHSVIQWNSGSLSLELSSVSLMQQWRLLLRLHLLNGGVIEWGTSRSVPQSLWLDLSEQFTSCLDQWVLLWHVKLGEHYWGERGLGIHGYFTRDVLGEHHVPLVLVIICSTELVQRGRIHSRYWVTRVWKRIRASLWLQWHLCHHAIEIVLRCLILTLQLLMCLV